jgi:hypothetical protein
MDIFYPLLGTAFSKEGVFQQPHPISLIETKKGEGKAHACAKA